MPQSADILLKEKKWQSITKTEKKHEPEAPVHTLIVPKTHYDNLAAGVPAEVIGHMMSVVPEVARLKGVGESGYRTVVNTGPDSAATVNHLHIHVLGGTKMGRFTFEGSYREAQ